MIPSLGHLDGLPLHAIHQPLLVCEATGQKSTERVFQRLGFSDANQSPTPKISPMIGSSTMPQAPCQRPLRSRHRLLWAYLARLFQGKVICIPREHYTP